MAVNADFSGKLRTDEIRAAKATSILDLVSRSVKLRREGREHVGLCPFHEERTPSFSVNEKKGVYQCFGCGAKGDVIEFARHTYRLSFQDAVRMLTGEDRPLPANIAAVRTSTPDEDDARMTEAAVSLWHHRDILPIDGTIGEQYLRSRGITVPLPSTLRFHPFHKHKASELYLPTLVGAVTVSPSRKIIAVHRTYLTHKGTQIPHSRPKAMLGPCKGGAVRLAAWAGGTLAITEGIETGLSVLQMTGIATWAALSTSGITNLVLPDEAKDILICADNDENGSGEKAARQAADRWTAEGRAVRIALPAATGSDFNDVLKSGAVFSP